MGQLDRWKATVGTAIALQWVVVLGFSGITWLAAGMAAARSLLFGGIAVALPNTILALWLSLRVYTKGSAGAAAMMAGEILKLTLTIVLLVAIVVRFKPDVVWLALIIGVVIAVKAQWLALWVTRRF